MSPCPACGTERAQHIALSVHWDPQVPIVVRHKCRNKTCGNDWSEEVRDLFGALRAAMENRGYAIDYTPRLLPHPNLEVPHER